MKNLKKIVSGTLLVGVLVATSMTAFAAVGNSPSQEALNTQTQTQERQHHTEFERGFNRSEENNEGFGMGHRGSRKGHRNTDTHHRNFENGERPELTEEQKTIRTEEMKVRLSEALAAGNISQEQYDAAMEDINSGLRPMFQARGHHGSEDHGNRGMCGLGINNSNSQTPNQSAAIK